MLTSLNATFIRRFAHKSLCIVVHFIEIVVTDLVLLLQRVESFWTVVRIQDTMHVLVAFKSDTDKIPSLLLIPIRTNPNGLDAWNHRSIAAG